MVEQTELSPETFLTQSGRNIQDLNIATDAVFYVW